MYYLPGFVRIAIVARSQSSHRGSPVIPLLAGWACMPKMKARIDLRLPAARNHLRRVLQARIRHLGACQHSRNFVGTRTVIQQPHLHLRPSIGFPLLQ